MFFYVNATSDNFLVNIFSNSGRLMPPIGYSKENPVKFKTHYNLLKKSKQTADWM